MNHCDKVLPGVIHRVIYEDMINDSENQIRKLIDFCNLEFEDGCLEFYKNKRAVRTPSSEQVRQPIYKKGVGQWKNYQEWLSPLKQILDEKL